MADNQEVMMADYVLPSGEAVIARAAAGCQSGAMPLGQGELMLTETRVLWFGRAGILNLPFSLWRPELELQFHEIGKITSPPLLGAINVRGKQGQLYIFNLQVGMLLNPLHVWHNNRAAKRIFAILQDKVRRPADTE